MDAGVAGFEEAQNVPCATFYGAGCGLYRDLLLDLTTLGGSPAPPPPPLPVLGASADVAELKPTRIFFARGPSPNMQTSLLAPGESDALTNAPYRQRQRRRELQSQDTDGEGGEADYLDVSDDPVVIRACSDVHTNNEELSLCETNGFENAVRFAPLSNPHALYCKFAIHADNCACHRAQWVMYDLGAEYDLRAVRLVTYKFGVPPPTPPPPPRPPPPRPPPRPPPSPPKPPPPPESPPPPFYFQCIGSIGTSDCYNEHVLMANNGVCEDGAEGSTSNVCLWGTDYPDCPYRCSPGGDWYAVPSDYMVQVIGGDDAECEPSVAYNDDRGRAVIEEGHTGDYSSCGNNHCAESCGCNSGWVVDGTEAGGTLNGALMIRYRQVFSKSGNCFATLGNTGHGNWYGQHELASYTVEHSPRVDDGFVTQACGPEHKDCPGGVCTCDNQHNWWKHCGGGEDHTSVYVNEHRRKDYVQKFGVSTVNGICDWPGSWRYEGIEIYVLPYTQHDGVHCSGFDSTRNPGALAVHVNTGETEQQVNGAYSQDFSDTLGPGATAEECARWCTGLGNHLCNAFTMWVDAYDEHYCSLKQVDRLLPITTPCPTPHATSATYVFTGLLGGDSPPPSPPPSPPSPPPPPPPPSPPSPPPAEWVACGNVIGIVAVGEVHTVPCVSDGNPAQAIRLVSYGPYHAAFAQVVVPGVAALGYGWESCLMYSSGGTAQFWGEGGEVEHPGSGCCDGDSSGYACIEQESGPGGYFEGIFETPSAITSVVVTTRTDCCPDHMTGFVVYYLRDTLEPPLPPATGRRLSEAPLPPPSPSPPPPPWPPGMVPSPPPYAPQDTGIGDDLAPHGGFDIWYSDSASFFGTKARTILEGQQERMSVYAIDATERGEYARGRYVSLRIYHPHKRLRFETMQVFGDIRQPPPPPPPGSGSGRRLFGAPEEEEPPPGFTPTPSPTPEPTPEPTPTPTPEPPSDSEYEWDSDPNAWWNNLEISRHQGELYARRVLPGAHGRSSAASVAVAITLAHPWRSVLAGQDATLDAMCRGLGGCDQGDYWTSIHNRDDADVDEHTRDPTHLPIDDAGWALQLLSRAIESAVHAVIEGMLLCLAPALCTTHCDVCDGWVGLGNATAEQVLRETELRLHASTRNASRSVLDCVGSFECLAEVAADVAEVLGDNARAMPATVRMERVAEANSELLTGAMEEAKQNASWQVRRPARFAMLQAHTEAVKAYEHTPLGEDEDAAEAGRRLSERPPPAPPPLTQLQQVMKLRTNETCQQLAIKNSTGAHDSHVQTTHLWMYMSGGGNDARGQGRVCVDCDFPAHTTSCRQHFAHVGRALTKLRLEAERPNKPDFATRKRRMHEHARRHLDEACCAIKPDGTEVCAAKYCEIHARNTLKKRITHVARKMTEQEHPSAVKHFGVAAQLGIDILNPELHPDPECRVNNHTTEAAKLECMGRSILHHAGKRHGLDYESTKAKMDEVGINIGETFAAMAKAAGIVREGRGPVKSAFFEKQARETAAADVLMRESRRRAEAKQAKGAGRKLAEAEEDEEEGSFGGHGLGQHALHAGSMRRQLQNASNVMHRGLMAVDRAATVANNRQSRESRSGYRAHARTPRPEELEWETVKGSFTSPLTAMLTVSAEEGSYASRFGGAIVKLNALRDRVGGALHTARRRLEAHDNRLRRRLSPDTAHADALHEALERKQLESPPEVQALELPESHALSWVHELVDWDHVFEEGSRLYGIVRNRHKLRETGTPHADIVKQHPTGYQYLDNARLSSPSILGDAVRRVLYRKETGADPPWHEPTVLHRVSRRMSERPDGGEGVGNHIRRLGVAFFEATIAAPFSFVDTLMPSGVTVEKSEITFWEATLRYIVSSTVGCYFVAPNNDEIDTQGDEGPEGGDRMFVMRPSKEKLCFPAVRTCAPLRLHDFRLRFSRLLVRLCSFHSRCRSCPRSARSRARKASTSTRSTTTTTATGAGRPRR